MCSIIASFNKDTVHRLAKLNEYRGQHSHSLFVFDNSKVVYSHRALGPLDIDSHDIPDGYILCHQQAPTTDNKTLDSVHPAEHSGHLLYHNGIVKDTEVKRMQQALNCPDITWDTMLILHQLIETRSPDNIDGTFSCAWFDGHSFYMFRNEISPLFIDHTSLIDRKDVAISSTKFDGSTLLEPNKIFELDLKRFAIHPVEYFTTKENPYFFG